jgi:hypothetical protein
VLHPDATSWGSGDGAPERLAAGTRTRGCCQVCSGRASTSVSARYTGAGLQARLSMKCVLGTSGPDLRSRKVKNAHGGVPRDKLLYSLTLSPLHNLVEILKSQCPGYLLHCGTIELTFQNLHLALLRAARVFSDWR